MANISNTGEVLAERMVTGYALLTDEERPLQEEVRPSIELGLLQTGLSLVVELRRQADGTIPTVIETSARNFAVALLGNVVTKQARLLDGDAYHYGRDLLRTFVREGKSLPMSAKDKY